MKADRRPILAFRDPAGRDVVVLQIRSAIGEIEVVDAVTMQVLGRGSFDHNARPFPWRIAVPVAEGWRVRVGGGEARVFPTAEEALGAEGLVRHRSLQGVPW